MKIYGSASDKLLYIVLLDVSRMIGMKPSISKDIKLIAGLTQLFLQRSPIPTSALPSVIAAFDDILSVAKPQSPQKSSPVLAPPPPARAAAARKPTAAPRQKAKRKLRAWKPVAATNVPTTPIEKLEAALKRSPLRLDDRSAMAVSRASGKPIGRDKLERAEQVDHRLALTFGFDFGSAKFTAEFDVQGDLGSQAVTALMEMLEVRA